MDNQTRFFLTEQRRRRLCAAGFPPCLAAPSAAPPPHAASSSRPAVHLLPPRRLHPSVVAGRPSGAQAVPAQGLVRQSSRQSSPLSGSRQQSSPSSPKDSLPAALPPSQGAPQGAPQGLPPRLNPPSRARQAPQVSQAAARSRFSEAPGDAHPRPAPAHEDPALWDPALCLGGGLTACGAPPPLCLDGVPVAPHAGVPVPLQARDDARARQAHERRLCDIPAIQPHAPRPSHPSHAVSQMVQARTLALCAPRSASTPDSTPGPGRVPDLASIQPPPLARGARGCASSGGLPHPPGGAGAARAAAARAVELVDLLQRLPGGYCTGGDAAAAAAAAAAASGRRRSVAPAENAGSVGGRGRTRGGGSAPPPLTRGGEPEGLSVPPKEGGWEGLSPPLSVPPLSGSEGLASPAEGRCARCSVPSAAVALEAAQQLLCRLSD